MARRIRPTGPVMLKMSGASYTDEATKTTVTMAANDFMSAVLRTVAFMQRLNGSSGGT